MHNNRFQKKPVEHYETKVSNTTLVSVIVMAYNHEKYILRCINSILKQETNFNFEIIIGEDNSNDQTRAICKNLADTYPKQIRLFLNDRANVVYYNDMPSGRFNFYYCLKNVESKYIALCDGDDYWIDDYKLQKQVNLIDSNNNCSYVFTRKKNINLSEKLTTEKKYNLPDFFDLHTLLKKNIMPSTQTIIFKKNALPKKFPDFFWGAFNGDWVLLFLLTHKKTIGFIDDFTAVYREGVGVISKTPMSLKMLNSIKTNKILNEFTNYEYDYHLGNFSWHFQNIAIDYYIKKKYLNFTYFFFRSILFSINFKKFSNKHSLIHFIKSIIKKRYIE